MDVVDNSKRRKCEVWSRCCGYMRPIDRWNEGKLSEFKDRTLFKVNKDSEGS